MFFFIYYMNCYNNRDLFFPDLYVTCSVRPAVKEWFKFLPSIAPPLLFVTKSATENDSLFADPTINCTVMNVK